MEGKNTFSDILAKIVLTDGSEEIALVHIEIESEKKAGFNKRMFNYFVDIWREHEKRVFAFALFIDEAVHWRKPAEDNFGFEFMGTDLIYKYHLKKTKNYNYRDYLDHENPITAALMTRMDFGEDSRALVKAEALNKMKKYKLTPEQRAILTHFIDRLLFLNKEEKKEFKVIIQREAKFKEVGEMLTTWEEEAMEKGIEKGIEKGMEKGMEKGKIEAAKKLLKEGMKREDIARILEIDEKSF